MTNVFQFYFVITYILENSIEMLPKIHHKERLEIFIPHSNLDKKNLDITNIATKPSSLLRGHSTIRAIQVVRIAVRLARDLIGILD